MLQYMRENTGSWIIKIILGLIVVVFIFLGMGSMKNQQGDAVATVNEEPITFDEFRRSYQDVVAQLRQQYGDNLTEEMLQLMQVKRQALEKVIGERLIAEEAKRLEISISEAELKASVLDVPAFQKDGRFDVETYKRVLSFSRLTPEMFEDLQKQQLKEKKIRDLVLNNIMVSDLEARAWFFYNAEKVAVNYCVFNPASYETTEPTQEQIQQYYDENQGQFKSETTVKVRYLKFSPGDYKGKLDITEARLETYYNENKDQYKRPAQVEANHILIRVAPDASDEAVEQARLRAMDIYEKASKPDSNFIDLAKEYSEDSSADNGGYLGFFTREEMVKPFSDKAFSMAPGSISEPVRTPYGWHIILVLSKFEESVKSFEEVKGKIKDSLEDAELGGLAYQDAGKAFDAVIDGDDLVQAGLIVGKEVLEAGPFPRNWTSTDVDDPKSFAAIAFETPVMEISDVKEIGDSYYIIMPLEINEPVQLTLAQVTDKIKSTLTASSKEAAAQQAAKDFITQFMGKETLALAAEHQGLKLSSTLPFTRADQIAEFGPESGFISAAFSLSDSNPVWPEPVKGVEGYYVIAFKDRTFPDEDEIAEELEAIRKSLVMAKQYRTYGAWIETLKTTATIDIKEGFLE